MKKWIKAEKNAYLVMYGKKCVKRFKWKTDAEEFLGRNRVDGRVVVERSIIANMRENDEQLPNYQYRIVKSVMKNNSEQFCWTDEFFVTRERAERMVAWMNADPSKKSNVRYKIASICG